MRKIRLNGVGCSLADYLYAKVDFEAPGFKKYLSQKDGDGGLTPGHLVFADELERFGGKNFHEILSETTAGKKPDTMNLGGPAIVAMINAAQLAHGQTQAEFYGAVGADDTAGQIFSIIKKTPVGIANYVTKAGASPFTDVLSDPNHNDGKGERTFINNIGAAANYGPEDLPESFFDADVLLFGATALVPRIHDGLTGLLRKAGEKGCVKVVTTVFDFRNEKKSGGKKWPLGDSDDGYAMTDLLIVDHMEALKLSGNPDINAAIQFFIDKGVSSLLVTNGAENITVYSDGRLFRKQPVVRLPVSAMVVETLKKHPEKKGDTTGCGDNFAGGVLGSLCAQLQSRGRGDMNLCEAAAWGVASGGFTCFLIGGTYLEKEPGEKLSQVARLFEAYAEQVKGLCQLEKKASL